MRSIQARFGFTAAVAVLMCLPAWSAVVFVTPSGTGSADGTSWAKALAGTALNTAIGNAAANTEFWVAAGTYLPGTQTTDTFTLQSGVNLYGGFAGNETSRDQRDFSKNVTVLSGDLNGDGTADDGDCATVVTATNVTNATLDGFGIMYGYAANDGWSAGLSCSGCDGTFVIANCTVANNAAAGQGGGGGMGFGGQSAPTLHGCTFKNNSANYGGALAGGSNTVPMDVTDCVFTSNSSRYWGGAVYVGGAQIVFTNCVFNANTSADEGGGIVVNNPATPGVLLMNCTFCGNSAGQGGALACENFGTCTLQNCILFGDSANLFAECNNLDSTLSLTCCDVQGSSVAGWCDIAPAVISNCFDQNPLFLDQANGDFQLASNSPCIGKGSSVGAPSTDILGVSRTQGAGIDLGAYEISAAVTCTISPPDAVAAGAQWKLSTGPDSDWQISGATLANVPFGTYTVAFSAVNGYIEPSDQTIQIRATAFISVTYTTATILYVTPGGAGKMDGSTWANALAGTTLNAAIGIAAANTEFWVAAGTYLPGTNTTDTFTLKSGVYLYGGFAGYETSLDQRNVSQNVTVFSGDLNGDGTADDGDCATVVTATNVTNATLDGFSIMYGYGANDGWSAGLGCNGCDGTFVIANCTITNNVAAGMGGGGGMGFGGQSAPTLRGCTFKNNSAYYGGALAGGSNTVPMNVTDCVFTSNSSNYFGGAVYLGSAQIVFTNCVFNANSAIYEGGGIAINGGGAPGVLLMNCTFCGNSAEFKGLGGAGGALICMTSGTAALQNCILWADSAGLCAECFNQDSTLSLTNCDVQGSSVSGWCDSAPAVISNCFDQDPLFLDQANGDLRLAGNSPCIDTGSFFGAPSTDILGVRRPQGAGIDLGAYETPVVSSVTCTLCPPDAVAAGAQWMLTSGPDTAWQISGATLASVPFGTYTVTFSTVTGYATPSAQTALASVTNTPCNVVATYIPATSVTCTLRPPEAVAAGAQWKLTSGPDTTWQASGATLASMPFGTYTVTFSTVTGYTTPSAQTVLASVTSTPCNVAATYHAVVHILSQPTTSPYPAYVNDTVTFTVVAAGDGLTYSWDFGDGTPHASTATATHVFSAPGTYAVTITVTDTYGYSATANLSMVVLETLNVSALTVKLHFAKPAANDSISLTGTLPLTAGFKASGQSVTVNIGGIQRTFVLNAKGASPKGHETFALSFKSKNGVATSSTAKFTAKWAKGTYAATLASAGLTDTNETGTFVHVPVSIGFGEYVFDTTATLVYKAKAGKSGSTSMPKKK